MPLVVGIDEAGYGPTLGPLIVAATIWNVEPQHVKTDWWKLLGDCVERSVRSRQWQLAVNDSKSVYNRKKGLSTLERPVLAFADAAGLDCSTFRSFLSCLGAQADQAFELPWYGDLNVPLPVQRAESKYENVAQRLKRSMSAAGVFCRGMLAAAVTEDKFNERVAATRNKAAVLIEQVLRLIHEAGSRAGGQDMIVRVDRLGGRTNYRSLLLSAFPKRHLHVIEVGEKSSRYRLAAAENDWFIEFAVSADQLHLPVALASMLAKYLREVLMQRFNAYWKGLLSELRPTAGYYTDAQRFLADIQPIVHAAGVPLERFVRRR